MSALGDFVRYGFAMALVGHAIIGISLVWDKALLSRPATQNLLSYVFWFGVISAFGLLLIPFGFKLPRLQFMLLGLGTGILDLVANYLYYAALQAGEASKELAAMGGFTPTATALIALPLLKQPFGGELLGFVLLTLGGFGMFLGDRTPLKNLKKMLPMLVLASFAFGGVSVFQRLVYDHSNFVSGYVLFTFGTTLGALAMLVPSSWRRQIFENSGEASPKGRLLYFANRFAAGVGAFLVVYSVSRTTPVLVNAISGIRYVVIFMASYAITRWKPSWFRENFEKSTLVAKFVATCLVVAGLALVGAHGGGGNNAAP